MSEKEPELIITDRRKFRADGEPTGVVSAPTEFKPDTASATTAPVAENIPVEGNKVVQMPQKKADEPPGNVAEEGAFNAPTDEQISATHSAYNSSTHQIDEVLAAANPGIQSMAEMNFSRLVQSIYMTAMMQMGAVAQEGQQPRVDILGARQSVDMLGVLSDKTKGNLTPEENTLLSTALFDLRMAFLEITQSIARSATQQAGKPSPIPGPIR